MIRWLTIYLFALASALNPALAALTVNQLSGFNAFTSGAPPAADPTVTFNGCTSDSSDLTTYTFTGVSVGTATSDRIILVGSSAEDSADLITHPTFTIGGVDAVEAATNFGSFSVHTGFAIAAVPTGTTTTIAVTYLETMTSLAICSWSLYGFSSAAFTTQSASTIDTGASFNNSVSVTAGDLVAAMSTAGVTTETIAADADLSTVGWTTGDVGAVATYAYGYTFPVSATGTVTVTTNWSGSSDVHTRVVVVTP